MHSENVFNFLVDMLMYLENVGWKLERYYISCREKQNKTELDISGSPFFFSYCYDFVLGWELEKSKSLDSF